MAEKTHQLASYRPAAGLRSPFANFASARRFQHFYKALLWRRALRVRLSRDTPAAGPTPHVLAGAVQQRLHHHAAAGSQLLHLHLKESKDLKPLHVPEAATGVASLFASHGLVPSAVDTWDTAAVAFDHPGV